MGSLTVYFVGLCTHLTQWTSDAAEHRVVLINASRDRLANGKLVRRHTARLRFSAFDTLPLSGATLRVNAANAGVSYDKSFYTCIPRMKDFTNERLAPLSASMAASKNADLVSAYFDAAGRFSAGKSKSGAAIAVLNVETDGDPKLTIDPFLGAPTVRELPDRATIFVENVDLASTPGVDHDFLLHYKMLTHVPHDARWPLDPLPCLVLDIEDDTVTVGPGCSNSNYP
jgi:hypothetical protein